MRRIFHLRNVVKLKNKPDCIPKSKLKGTKAKGIAYERKLSKVLFGEYNPWFYFVDMNGGGYCQPDFVIEKDDYVVVVEVKLTNVKQAEEQLKYLYVPVIGFYYNKLVKPVIVVKYLSKEVSEDRICLNMEEAMRCKDVPVVHWMGGRL